VTGPYPQGTDYGNGVADRFRIFLDSLPAG
jgi:hypothetical protein